MNAIVVPNALTDAANAAGKLHRQAYIITVRLGRMTLPNQPAPTLKELDNLCSRLLECQDALNTLSRELTYYMADPWDISTGSQADVNSTLGR